MADQTPYPEPDDVGEEIEVDIQAFLPEGVTLGEADDEPAEPVEERVSESVAEPAEPEIPAWARDEPAAEAVQTPDPEPDVDEPPVESDIEESEPAPDGAIDELAEEPADEVETVGSAEPETPAWARDEPAAEAARTPDPEPDVDEPPVESDVEESEPAADGAIDELAEEPGEEVETVEVVEPEPVEPETDGAVDGVTAEDPVDRPVVEVETVAVAGVVMVDDGPEPEVPAWAIDDPDPTEETSEPVPVAEEDAGPAAEDQVEARGEAHAEVAEDDEAEGAVATVPDGDAGPPEPNDEHVDIAVLEQLEADLVEVDEALAAIDAGDLDRSPLLRRLLAEQA